MTKTLIAASTAALLGLSTLGCGGREDSLARQVEGYEVIDEGSASGVASTIHAPGEVVAPVLEATPDLTGTNLDTTTAFTTLDPVLGVPPTTETSTDTLASGLPGATPTYPPVTTGAPRYPSTSRSAPTVATTPRPQGTPQIDIRRSTPEPVEDDVRESEPADDPEVEATPEPESEPEPEPEPEPEMDSATDRDAADAADDPDPL